MFNEKIIYNYHTGFVDFPDQYALTIYFSGCNLSCPFCYNKHVNTDPSNYSINDILEKKSRIENTLGKSNIGIVFSGGEPCIQSNFSKIINTFVSNPLSIHTNGIVTPNTLNKFEAVTLSLKTTECNIPKDYIKSFINSMYYYKDSKIKIINVVKYKKYIDQYLETLLKIQNDIEKTGFRVKFIDYIKY